MQSFNRYDSDRPTSAYVRRRLAEATLSQDQYDGSAWVQLDPGPAAVSSLSPSAQSLHNGLLGNALQHIDRYMDQETHALSIGESLESEINMNNNWYSPPAAPPVVSSTGYMHLPGAFPANASGTSSSDQVVSMSSISHKKHNATITYYDDGNTLQAIHDIDLDMVTKRCPLLGIAFEESRSGPQLFLETLSAKTAEPFQRFLHTGSYAGPSMEWNSGGMYEDVPTSVLLHCEMFRLGDIYDLPDMKSQAYVNVLRQCEFGCSSPNRPIDLCEAIRFVYNHLEKQEQLVDALVNYCVACFLRHRLAEDVEFKQLAYDLRPFHQDLCKNCMDRGFENETAAAIIQMPFEPHRPETYASTEDRRSMDDVVFHFHANDEMDSPKKRKRADLETVLPIRSAQEAISGLKQKVQSGGTVADVMEHKRRATGHVEIEIPPAIVKEEEEFEEIDLGRSPEGAVDSDSESFEWVNAIPANLKVDGANIGLPLRPKEPPKVERTAGDESDSDWSLV